LRKLMLREKLTIAIILFPVLIFAADNPQATTSSAATAPANAAGITDNQAAGGQAQNSNPSTAANPNEMLLAQVSNPVNPVVSPSAPNPATPPEERLPDQNPPVSDPLPNPEPANNDAAEQAGALASAESSDSLSEKELDKGIKVNQERLSLDLKGIDINELLRILSVKMGVTIVPTRSVNGRVNIFLNNLTFNDALDVILISQDLAMDRQGNIINIMTATDYERLYGKKYNEKRKFSSYKLSYAKPATVLAALAQVKSDIGKVIIDEASGTVLIIDTPERLELLEKTIKELDVPPETDIIDIKYAKPADMKTHLSAAITAGPGEVLVDERSSKVVVSDLSEKMKKLKRIVKAFDEESRQVFIEAEIVQITLKDEYQRQINWERVFSSKIDGLDIKGVFPVAASFTPSPLLTADYVSMAVGTLARDKYNATLTLLSTLGDTKILSRPHIAVVNNQEAKILVGSREAYITQTQSQAESTTVTAESVQFIDVGVKLNVVPNINKDGYITMKIKPEVSSVRETLKTTLGSQVPIVETSESETVVKVKDGNMIMIAGLMKEDKRKDITGWPILSRLPIIGAAFGARAGLRKKTEVIIFLTPHIIKGNEPIATSELQSMMPSDMVPEEIGDDMIDERIRKIKPTKTDSGSPADIALEDDTKSVFNAPEQTEEKSSTVNIQDKMKGIKEY